VAVVSQGISSSARSQSVRLGTTSLGVGSRWLVRVSLLTVGLAGGFAFIFHRYFPSTGFTLPRYEYWSMGLVTAVAFLGSIRVHELAYLPVRQLSTLWTGGNYPESGRTAHTPTARTELFTGVAGLAVSLALAASFLFLADVGSANQRWLPVQMVLGYLAAINALILMFHTLPAFPLDGGRVVRSVLWMLTGNLSRATFWASLAGQGFGLILMGAGAYLCFRWNWFGGLSCMLVGLCLNAAARSGYRQLLLRQPAGDQPAHSGAHATMVPCGWKRAVEVAGVFLGLLLLCLLTT
jgi:Zn-dependent protease